LQKKNYNSLKQIKMNKQDLKAKFEVGDRVVHHFSGRYATIEEYKPGNAVRELMIRLDGDRFPISEDSVNVTKLPKKKVEIITISMADNQQKRDLAHYPKTLQAIVGDQDAHILDLLGIWTTAGSFIMSLERSARGQKIAIKAEVIW
jgi:hypothetical protein